MKAILKSDRKVIIDVRYMFTDYTMNVDVYQDKNGELYSEHELEMLEYQGG